MNIRRISTRAMIAIFLILVLLVGGGNLWNEYYLNGQVKDTQSSQQKAQQQSQKLAADQAAAQAKLGAEVESKLCSSLDKLEPLADLRPPAGNPVGNPSRAFEQQLVLKLQPLAQLGKDINCK